MRRSRSALDRSGIAKTSQEPGRRSGRKRPATSAGSESWLRLAGVWAVAAKLLLVPLVIDPLGADAFALPKSAVSRGLLYMLLVVAFAYLARRRQVPRPTSLAIAVAAFLGVSGVATAFAVDPMTALYGAHRRYLGLTSILDGASLAGAIALFVRTRRDLLTLGATSMAALCLTAAYEVIQLFGKDPIVWPEARLTSFIGNSTSLGGYLAILTSVSFGVVLLSWTRLYWTPRMILLALTMVSAALTVETSARAPTLALIPSMLFAIVIARRARSVRIGRRTLLVAVAAVLLGSAGLALGPMRDRLAQLVSSQDLSTIERSVIYETAIHGILSRPVLGVGPDGMGSIYLTLRAPETALMALTPTQTSTHSWLLHYALGTGVVGAVAFIAMVGIALAQSRRRVGEPDGVAAAIGAIVLFAYLAQGLVSINSVVTDMLMWVGVGLIAIPREVPPSPRIVDQRRTWYGDWPIAIVAVALGLLIAGSVRNVLEANRAVHASNLARNAGNFGLAQRAGQLAVERDPGRADPWNVLGLSYSRREPERAAQAFAHATEHAPRDPVYLLNLAAEVVVAYGKDDSRFGSASAQARRAIDLDPNGPVTLRRASEIFAALQQLDAAIEAGRRARDLTPEDPNAHDRLAELLSEAGRPDEAITELERAILLDPGRAKSARLELPLELRLRLSRLYRLTGRLAEAKSLIRPPTVVSADVTCSPRNGSGDVPRVGPRPRCLRITFATEEALQAEDTRGDSARDLRNYLIGGAPLHDGTVVEYDGKTIVMIQFPADSVPPAPGTVVVIRGVANVVGQPTHPDPASVKLP